MQHLTQGTSGNRSATSKKIKILESNVL